MSLISSKHYGEMTTEDKISQRTYGYTLRTTAGDLWKTPKQEKGTKREEYIFQMWKLGILFKQYTSQMDLKF